MKSIMVLFTIIFVLTGCSTSGGEDKFSRTYVSSHIIVNKTTQAEVKALYGVPDDQSSSSDGSVTWRYYKGGNLSTASSVLGYIPGASALSSAVGMASGAQNASDSMTKASGKLTGNTEQHSDYLSVWFDKNNVVSNWFM
ncbi:hypothetical protein ARC310_05350 [Pantoea ananatis]|uniref:hypothetical protein n=1 Tax=Pantoea ananas TaxID=553 RepID=UPI000DA6DB7F|nr:hypothetical protein [Pantoea ananatis]PZD66728.1 hypothetical protein ARC310_05350 [Pantoea ananatis]PZD69984.1 hypothetical protein ARC311_01115 [Pantoea ananatis]